MGQPFLILDANLAILLAAGITNRRYVQVHKRLNTFDLEDFDALVRLVDNAPGVIFTPNVLTETSNLIRYIQNPARQEISKTLAILAAKFSENYVPSADAFGRPEYVRLGLTDAVLIELATKGGAILTVDFDLYFAALNAGLIAINYNHLRELRLDARG